jgi:hypothetical protein
VILYTLFSAHVQIPAIAVAYAARCVVIRPRRGGSNVQVAGDKSGRVGAHHGCGLLAAMIDCGMGPTS